MRDFNGPGFVKFLYNHNPFYLISAAVVLYGFRTATEDASFAANPWFLASLFAGYTTLLALTSWVIVRFGRVWDDARSIFMVLLLLFMALSASLDGVFATESTTALGIAAAGFAFTVAITELLVWSLKIRFRLLFRGPLYAMFAISFFYPWLFSLQKQHWPELDYRMIILAFPFLVAFSILSLIPAVRKTKSYVAKNGTPWNWPLYPWSIFVLAIVGMVGRTIMLGLSFDPTPENGMLGTWIFVPIFLAIMWLVFEIGAVEQNDELQIFAMLLMPFSIALAIAWPSFSNTTYYDEITLGVGSPVWLTLLSLVAIYFVAWMRKVEGSSFFLTLSLSGASLLNQNGSFIAEFADIQAWPCLALGVWSIASKDRFYRCGSWFLACCCFCVPAANGITPWVSDALGTSATFSGQEALIATNMVLLCACLLVCIFSGQFARQLKVLLAFAMPCLASLAATVSIFKSEHATLAVVYGAGLAVAGSLIFAAIRSRLHLSAAAISLGASLFAAIPLMEVSVRERDFRLATFLGVGLACFLVGLLVSAIKAGWMRKFNSGMGKLKSEFHDAFPRNQQSVQTE